MKILGLLPRKGAVTGYRIVRPLSKVGGKTMRCFKSGFGSLLNKNEEISSEDLAKRFKQKADVFVIKYIEDFNTANILFWIRDKNKAKIVVDIDDNIWQIPEDSIILDTDEDIQSHAKRGLWTIEMVKAADAVTVSTEPLRNLLKKYNDVTVLPNLINPKDWKFKRKKHDKIKIGWIYSHTHYPDVKVIKDALNKIKAKYKDKIEIIIFGSDLQVFDFKPIHHWGVKFSDYPKRLTELSFDISICPLEDNAFNRCKSNIKWMESSLSGASVVASKVYPYEYSIKNGKTGYLASTTGQWVKHLSNLIESKEKREELVKNAKEVILDKYNIEKDKSIKKFYKSL